MYGTVLRTGCMVLSYVPAVWYCVTYRLYGTELRTGCMVPYALVRNTVPYIWYT
jgi:hypothetical protein